MRTNTDYVWDAGAGMPVALQETNDPNNGPPVTTTYLYGLDLIATTVGAGASVFYLSDGLGSTRELVTSSADVVDGYHYTYDVWGGLRSAQPATMNDFRFTGEQTDVRANRGLVYLRARFYDPALGRFLNRDPLPLGNRYAYVNDNPANGADPSGLEPEDEPVAVPLPAAGSVGTKRNCDAGWLDCIERIAPQERFKRRTDPDKYFRTDDPYNDVCNAFRKRCYDEIFKGVKNPSFNELGARRLMKEMNRKLESSFLPNIGLRFPETGSGGYLGSPSKETPFSFGCYFGPWR